MALSTPRDPKPVPTGQMTTAAFRVFKDGEGRLCRENDPGASFLAYAVGDQILHQEEQDYLALAEPKMATPVTTKMLKQTANKGA